MAKTRLKNMKITSVDMVPRGANPDAFIKLLKSAEQEVADSLAQKIGKAIAKAFGVKIFEEEIKRIIKEQAETFSEQANKRQIREEIWSTIYALQDSISSIVNDQDLDAEKRTAMLKQSMTEFNTVMNAYIDSWSQGKPATQVAKEAPTEAAIQSMKATRDWLDRTIAKAENPGANDEDDDPDDDDDDPEPAPGKTNVGKGAGPVNKGNQSGVTAVTKGDLFDMATIDKAKMSAEDKATFERLEKQYAAEEPAAGTEPVKKEEPGTHPQTPPQTPPATPEIHPEVKKAIDEMAELKKSVEMNELTTVAKKYEIIGKKADELAPKLYELKKAGGTAYVDYVGVLDEMVETVAGSGIFKELGSNRSGGNPTMADVEKAAADIMKAEPGLSHASAIVKACDMNPELKAKYEGR